MERVRTTVNRTNIHDRERFLWPSLVWSLAGWPRVNRVQMNLRYSFVLGADSFCSVLAVAVVRQLLEAPLNLVAQVVCARWGHVMNSDVAVYSEVGVQSELTDGVFPHLVETCP